MMSGKSRFLEILDRLDESFGRAEKPDITDPFEQVLFEQVAYLTNDAKRVAAFEALRERIGLAPRNILEAQQSDLIEVASSGGSAIVEKRVSRMRDAARIVMQNWEGDLSGVLDLSYEKARRILSGFAMIGEPGADKILLFAGSSSRPALDSNGLRVLLRIGYGSEEDQYRKAYRSVIEAVEAEVDDRWESAYGAYVQLKRLGREVCKRSEPQCGACPLNDLCAYHEKARSGTGAPES